MRASSADCGFGAAHHACQKHDAAIVGPRAIPQAQLATADRLRLDDRQRTRTPWRICKILLDVSKADLRSDSTNVKAKLP